MLQFETFVGKDNQYYFNLKNEQKVLLKSEGYTAASGRDNGIESVKKNASDSSLYSSDDNNFILKATNGQTIASSTIFSSKKEVQEAMNLVQKEAPYATVSER